mgnify:CR=1 FL=1
MKKVQTKIREKYKYNPYAEDQREIEWQLVNVRKAGSYRKYNIATTPLVWLNSRKYITEEQFQAGEYFSKLCGRAQVGRVKSALNFSISNKTTWNDKSTSQLDSINKLGFIHNHLGDKTAHILWLLCFAGYNIKDIKQIYHFKQNYIGDKIREALQDLSDLLNKNS